MPSHWVGERGTVVHELIFVNYYKAEVLVVFSAFSIFNFEHKSVSLVCHDNFIQVNEYYLSQLRWERILSLSTEVRKNVIFVDWSEREYYLCWLKWGRMLSLLTDVKNYIIFVDWSEKKYYLFRLRWEKILFLSPEERKNIILFDRGEKEYYLCLL